MSPCAFWPFHGRIEKSTQIFSFFFFVLELFISFGVQFQSRVGQFWFQMSYNHSVSDDSSFNRYIPEMVSTDTIDYQVLFDVPFSPLYDSSSDYNLQALLNSNQNQQNPVDEFTCPDQLVSGLFPSSPPTDQLENLSLYQTNQFPSLSFDPNLENGYENFSSSNCLEVKNEECQVDFDSAYSDVNENVAKYLQRSFSSNSLPDFSFQPTFDSLWNHRIFKARP